MNKLQENVEKINEDRKKFIAFEYAMEVPLGITVIKDDGSIKGRVESADNKNIYTTMEKFPKLTFKTIYKDWLFETQPGNYMIAGKPDDSGIIVP